MQECTLNGRRNRADKMPYTFQVVSDWMKKWLTRLAYMMSIILPVFTETTMVRQVFQYCSTMVRDKSSISGSSKHSQRSDFTERVTERRAVQGLDIMKPFFCASLIILSGAGSMVFRSRCHIVALSVVFQFVIRLTCPGTHICRTTGRNRISALAAGQQKKRKEMREGSEIRREDTGCQKASPPCEACYAIQQIKSKGRIGRCCTKTSGI